MSRHWIAALTLTVLVVPVSADPEVAPPPREKFPLMSWRSDANRKKLVAAGGGTEKSEAAVAAGLKWLADQQQKEGHWAFMIRGERVAATGLAVLCFLGSGHTPDGDSKYAKVVAKGISYLVSQQNDKGLIFTMPAGGSSSKMYEHGIGALALVEAYALTGDEKLRAPCQKAIDLTTSTMHREGGWRYDPTQFAAGDISVTGWQVQVLTAAKRYTDLKVPGDTLAKASAFVGKCEYSKTPGRYGYMPGTPPTKPSASASALCSKIALDDWAADNKALVEGVKLLPPASAEPQTRMYTDDGYYLYYASRAVFCHGGDAWAKQWNPKLLDHLLPLQQKDGMWKTTGGQFSRSVGDFGTTCFFLLTLETYYRYPRP